MTRLLRDRRAWLFTAVLAALLAVHLSGLGRDLSLDALAANRAALAGFVAAHGAAAALAYVAVYALAVALSVPGAVVLTLAGGFLFGAAAGAALAAVGATAGATAVFLLARRILGRDALARLGPRAAALAAAIRADAWSWLLVLRLVPLFPFFLVNLVPAFVGVALPVYVATTFLGILPATFVFSLAGAGLGGVLDAGGTLTPASVLTPEILGALLGLALLSLAAIPLRRRLAARGPQSSGQSGGGSAR
ncbi:MAG: VTT domain-containing protein [Acetobacteraceae bacterium]|nr:VTT domain-containing protein [Acetobacteraceae bacterium]MDW8397524.1 VTT domain-containing protein [Acetobacteraceae bacterium]